MSTGPIISDLQKINPSSIIELFTLETTLALHGSAQTYRFHNCTSLNNNGDVVWAGNSYIKLPIKAEGFAYQRGQLPRPTLSVSNLAGTPNISAILLEVNKTTVGNDLTGAKVTRIRTLAKYIDAVNFADNTNATADPNAEFPREVYYIDRKSTENRTVVTWELAAVFDLVGIRAPKRQCTRSIFPTVGTFKS